MNRTLIILALVLGGAVIALLSWILSSADERESTKRELLETGRVSTKRPPREGPLGPRPGGMAREILRIQFPAADPRREAGGPCVLSLRASNAYFRRRGLGEAAYLRGGLSRADTDALLARTAEIGSSGTPGTGDFAITIHADGPEVHRTATVEAVLSLLEPLGRHERPLAAEAVRLQVHAVDAASEGVEPESWPLPGQDPGELLESAGEVRITSALYDRIAAAQRDGTVFTHGDPPRLYRIAALEIVLP